MALGRRSLLGGAAGLGAALAAPNVGRAAGPKVLKFVPQADLAILDPVFTTSYVTRNHGYMVFDTLFGLDDAGRPQPQMLESVVADSNGLGWTLRLRDGLRFHDNTPVLARDALASIRRWGAKDTFGTVLMAATDEVSAPDDRTVRFGLKKPFPLLPDAMAKTTSYSLFVMPERLARTDPSKGVTDMVGSGPYRYLAGEAVPGAHFAYARFEGYGPRPEGTPSQTAGPKRAWFDRVEWQVIPDSATAAAALAAGEVDWWEQPIVDLQAMLAARSDVAVEVKDTAGLIGILRLNSIEAPFDNPATRRALLSAVRQKEFMLAVAGDRPSLWRDGVGVFTPGSAMANDAGMEVFAGPLDPAKIRDALAQAGYAGQKVVLMNPADNPPVAATSAVAADLMQKIGMNVDNISMDWGTLQQRRTSKEPVDKGGWSLFITFVSGQEMLSPASHQMIRGNGAKAYYGWPVSPTIERLRDAWFDAPDLAAQQALCRQIQMAVWQDVPYIPFGQYLQATAYRRDITGILNGFPKFYNARRG